jgi:hypothetical protein
MAGLRQMARTCYAAAMSKTPDRMSGSPPASGLELAARMVSQRCAGSRAFIVQEAQR